MGSGKGGGVRQRREQEKGDGARRGGLVHAQHERATIELIAAPQLVEYVAMREHTTPLGGGCGPSHGDRHVAQTERIEDGARAASAVLGLCPGERGRRRRRAM